MKETERKPKARIKITLDCDRACPYCINKCKKYRDRWSTFGTLEAVKWSDFRTIIVSGGEPTTDMRLRDIVRGLRIYTDGLVPIYLQTNGWGLTKKLVQDMDQDIDGIGLSVHDLDEFKHFLPRWEDIVRIKPIRLYVQDTLSAQVGDLVHRASGSGLFNWRVWHDGDFDPTEHIYVYKGWMTTPVLKDPA